MALILGLQPKLGWGKTQKKKKVKNNLIQI